MGREAVELELPQPASPQQLAWLHVTRIRVRSITFTVEDGLSSRDVSAMWMEAALFTTSTDMLAASTDTLEVRPPPRHGFHPFCMQCVFN